VTVWFAVPSKRPPAYAEKVLAKWRDLGYKLALWRDLGDAPIDCDLALFDRYRGYHHAVNKLVHGILTQDPEAAWIVTGGDDIDPVVGVRAETLGAECSRHFGGTFGVMQPCGDTWCCPNSFCGSPWMGREFCRRMYGGRGPFCEAYYHMYGDNEMWQVSQALGILWPRPDLTHYHHHWQREKLPEPEFLKLACKAHGTLAKLFQERKAAGFPGHEPIP